MRIDPPASFPWAPATIPEATAAAEPPLEPPDVLLGSQGFRVEPNLAGSVDAPMANSGRLVFPKMINPALFIRFTNSLSSLDTKSPKNTEPAVVRIPAHSAMKSFNRNGTP